MEEHTATTYTVQVGIQQVGYTTTNTSSGLHLFALPSGTGFRFPRLLHSSFTWLLPSLGGHALDSVRMTANQSPVPGEDIDPLSDPEERRVLYAALDSFR